MKPHQVIIGVLIALARAAALRGRYLAVALVLAVAALGGCASNPDDHLRTDPALSLAEDPPVSALRMYEAGLTDGIAIGRQAALDDLRSESVLTLRSSDVELCPDKVSWIERFAGQPTWESREESFRLYENCMDRDHYKTRRLREIHSTIQSAQ